MALDCDGSSGFSCMSSSDCLLLRTVCTESDLQAFENILDPETVDAIRKIDDSLKNHDRKQEEAMRATVSAIGNAHASLLFLPCGKEALTLLQKHISSTHDIDIIPSWKDLAGALHFDTLTISAIKNPDPAECLVTILKSYSTKPGSKLKDIVEAFFTIKRYECLQVAVDYFPDIATKAAQQEMKITDVDKVTAVNGNNSTLQNLMQELKRSLPEILQPVTPEVSQVCEPVKQISNVRTTSEILVQSVMNSQMPCIKNQSKKKYLKRVLITFTSDGRETAYNVAQILWQMKPLPVGVLILGRHADKVESQPYQFISHQVAKMDYVIPIVTPGYLEALGKKPPSDSTDIDGKYVKLIHDILSSEYVRNGCMNKKVRVIIPDIYLTQVQNHCHFMLDNMLKVFYSESNLDLLISRSIYKSYSFNENRTCLVHSVVSS